MSCSLSWRFSSRLCSMMPAVTHPCLVPLPDGTTALSMYKPTACTCLLGVSSFRCFFLWVKGFLLNWLLSEYLRPFLCGRTILDYWTILMIHCTVSVTAGQKADTLRACWYNIFASPEGYRKFKSAHRFGVYWNHMLLWYLNMWPVFVSYKAFP